MPPRLVANRAQVGVTPAAFGATGNGRQPTSELRQAGSIAVADFAPHAVAIADPVGGARVSGALE